MREVRIHHPFPFKNNQLLTLTEDAANHVGRVLRMQAGQPLTLFDGQNNCAHVFIEDVSKKTVTVKVNDTFVHNVESPLYLHLGQVISRGDKMEFTIQKAVELGVCEITPLYSERCGVKLDQERAIKKHQQWEKIIISACEQCGRNSVPKLNQIETLEQWVKKTAAPLKLNLHPRAEFGINQLGIDPHNKHIELLIGSEGGLSETEIQMTLDNNFTEILLGPRVLRTETAALTVISMLQAKFGDLG